jgi:hypothetical protein
MKLASRSTPSPDGEFVWGRLVLAPGHLGLILELYSLLVSALQDSLGNKVKNMASAPGLSFVGIKVEWSSGFREACTVVSSIVSDEVGNAVRGNARSSGGVV